MEFEVIAVLAFLVGWNSRAGVGRWFLDRTPKSK